MEFKVVGIMVSKGGSGFQNQDDIIFVPVKSAQRYFSGDQYLTTIAVQASSPQVMSQAQADITALLLERHKISDSSLADFSVLNQSDILSSASSITSTLTYLLAAIGGISLLVGGIGIMNMMLTTVTERTCEIGLRKAIGAKKKDISMQFLAEAVALTVIGGIIGIALGWLISYGVNLTGLVKTSVSLTSVLLAFGVSAITGIVFGYYPAHSHTSGHHHWHDLKLPRRYRHRVPQEQSSCIRPFPEIRSRHPSPYRMPAPTLSISLPLGFSFNCSRTETPDQNLATCGSTLARLSHPVNEPNLSVPIFLLAKVASPGIPRRMLPIDFRMFFDTPM
jgi:hypothetical protein